MKNKSSSDYAYARELVANTPISEETRLKKSLAVSGKKNPMFGVPCPTLGQKASLETRIKISKSKKGGKNPQWGLTGELSPNWKRTFTEEALENYKIANSGERNPCFGRTGEKHPMYGIKHTAEAKQKMKEKMKLSMIICEYCNRKNYKNIHNRFHGKKCKLNPENL